VARLVADHQPSKRIAAILGVTRATVDDHIQNISAKIPAPPGSPRVRIILWWHGVEGDSAA